MIPSSDVVGRGRDGGGGGAEVVVAEDCLRLLMLLDDELLLGTGIYSGASLGPPSGDRISRSGFK